jgi:uncharacterized protein involved in exopolysaccharide biosynthesis
MRVGDEDEWGERRVERSADPRPRYSAREIVSLLWREKVWMFAAFAAVFALGTFGVLTLPQMFSARSSLLIGLGQEYVYQPRAGDAARGAVPQTGDVVQSEVEILSSQELKRRVIRSLGVDGVAPKLVAAWTAADTLHRRLIEAKLVQKLTHGLKIETTPDTGVVRLSYQDNDPDRAATILNALVDGYLTYRRQVLTNQTSPLIGREKAAFEQRLGEADAAYEQFQTQNGVGDLPTEKASLAVLRQSLVDDRYKAEAALGEATSRLASLTRDLASTPREIEIQRDLDLSAAGRLSALRLERRELLGRYKADAPPVREVDAKIAAIESYAAAPASEKEKRLGANPVRQDLDRQRIDLSAQIAAAARRRDELGRQLEEVTQRQQRLTVLESQWQALTVEREVLQANVRAFAQRQEEARAAQDLAGAGDDSVRVVERAAPPAESPSLKRPLFILVLLFAVFTGVCAGLARVFSRPGFATPGSAGRTLGLPVLATAPLKRAVA